MINDLVNLLELAHEMHLPARWLRLQADAGTIPCLRVGRRRLFNLPAVRQALAERAAQTPTPLTQEAKP